MEECLASQKAFKSHYSKNPVILKSLIAGVLGIGAGAAVSSAAASTAATTGFAGFMGHFVSWPLIGGWASSIVGGAAASAATAALPIAAATALGVSIPVYILLRKKTKSFQQGSSLDALAYVVGEFIFLPMLAKYNEVLSTMPQAKDYARKSAVEKICEWGYTKTFAENLTDSYLCRISSYEIMNRFNTYLSNIDKLGKKELYKDVCYKSEIPPQGIRKIATKLAEFVIPNQNTH